MIVTSLQKINVDVRIGRESALLPIIAIKLPASIGEKSTSEPHREKTGLRDFRPGPTQTGLYKLRSRLEA